MLWNVRGLRGRERDRPVPNGDESLTSCEGFLLFLWRDNSVCSSSLSRLFVIDLVSFRFSLISATCALISLTKLVSAFSNLAISDSGFDGFELLGICVWSPIGL